MNLMPYAASIASDQPMHTLSLVGSCLSTIKSRKNRRTWKLLSTMSECAGRSGATYAGSIGLKTNFRTTRLNFK
ncbi:hypothetical protein DPMN_093591 [Dreissena polymorpha]|uniref:Uncharacterized protein n=1 Tax=Dreissena polymorpha TaxID=45954 RepID=A0A9D4L611_DREPO|nr:hypothetical protein DPMN_093591 [Dreissena polymorpha]